MRRRERRMPLELDDHVLRDVGLTRANTAFCLCLARPPPPIDRKNRRNLHDQPASSLYVSTVTEFRKPEIVA
jgi:hypothetical protein